MNFPILNFEIFSSDELISDYIIIEIISEKQNLSATFYFSVI